MAAVVNIPLHPNAALYRNEDQLGNTPLETTPYATAINPLRHCPTLRKTEPNADQNQKTDQDRNETAMKTVSITASLSI